MPGNRGVNRDNQKKTNRGLAMKLLATGQCSSRVELSRAMGLTKTAISQIMGSMIQSGLVIETRKVDTQELGRNPIGLAVSPDFPKFIGIIIQRGFCEAVISDLQLHIMRRRRIEKEFADNHDLMETIYELTDEMLAAGVPIAGIGIASIGPVRVTEGMIARPFFFNQVGNICIRKLMQERYHLPVFFDHNNQSAALAEQLYGNARGFSDILLVGVGTGVGCGILVGGERIHSQTGYAPEIGHVSIDRHGIPCVCGNVGCLERYINTPEVLGKLREAAGKNLTYGQFCREYKDPAVNAVMQEVIQDLVTAITSVLNVLNSQIVILSSDCCLWPDEYIQEVEKEINERKFGNGNVRILVRKPYFLEDVEVLGAAANAVAQVFSGELVL